jgi:PST family polysaccharide transporter
MQSAFWAAAGSLLRYALAGITTLALARLLEPRHFGLVAITVIAQELIGHVAIVGFHDALIQRPHLDAVDLDSAFWSLFAAAGGCVLLVVGLSPLVAVWFDAPLLAPLLVSMALAAWLRALATVPRALLARRLDFRTPVVARAAGMVAGGVCALALAALGGGAWSLVVQVAVLNFVSTVLVWRAVAWRPRRTWSRAALKPLWAFAPSVAAFTLLDYVISNADDQFVGYRLGTAALGFYAMAYSVMAWPVRDVLGGVSVVLYPIFSRLQTDRARLQAAYLESLQLSAAFAFPTLALIAITAPVLIPWLLGVRWAPIVLTVQILAISGIRESTMMLNGLVYRAVGRPQLHVLLEAASTGCYLVAFAVGLRQGIEGVAFFYALTGLVLHPVSWWLLLGTLDLSLRRWLGALLPVGAATLFTAIVASLVMHLARTRWALSDGPALAITAIGAAAVYGVSLFLFPALGVRHVLSAAAQVVRQRSRRIGASP